MEAAEAAATSAKEDAQTARGEVQVLRASQSFLRKSLERRARVVKRLMSNALHSGSADELARLGVPEHITMRAVLRDEAGPGVLLGDSVSSMPTPAVDGREGAGAAGTSQGAPPTSPPRIDLDELYVSVKVRTDTPFAKIAEALAQRLRLDASRVRLTVDAAYENGGEWVSPEDTPAELGLVDGSVVHICPMTTTF